MRKILFLLLVSGLVASDQDWLKLAKKVIEKPDSFGSLKPINPHAVNGKLPNSNGSFIPLRQNSDYSQWAEVGFPTELKEYPERECFGDNEEPCLPTKYANTLMLTAAKSRGFSTENITEFSIALAKEIGKKQTPNFDAFVNVFNYDKWAQENCLVATHILKEQANSWLILNSEKISISNITLNVNNKVELKSDSMSIEGKSLIPLLMSSTNDNNENSLIINFESSMKKDSTIEIERVLLSTSSNSGLYDEYGCVSSTIIRRERYFSCKIQHLSNVSPVQRYVMRMGISQALQKYLEKLAQNGLYITLKGENGDLETQVSRVTGESMEFFGRPISGLKSLNLSTHSDHLHLWNMVFLTNRWISLNFQEQDSASLLSSYIFMQNDTQQTFANSTKMVLNEPEFMKKSTTCRSHYKTFQQLPATINYEMCGDYWRKTNPLAYMENEYVCPQVCAPRRENPWADMLSTFESYVSYYEQVFLLKTRQELNEITQMNDVCAQIPLAKPDTCKKSGSSQDSFSCECKHKNLVWQIPHKANYKGMRLPQCVPMREKEWAILPYTLDECKIMCGGVDKDKLQRCFIQAMKTTRSARASVFDVLLISSKLICECDKGSCEMNDDICTINYPKNMIKTWAKVPHNVWDSDKSLNSWSVINGNSLCNVKPGNNNLCFQNHNRPWKFSCFCASGDMARSKALGHVDNCKNEQKTKAELEPKLFAAEGVWSSWFIESECEPTCGAHRRKTKKRVCVGDFPCIGVSFKEVDCEKKVCSGGKSSTGQVFDSSRISTPGEREQYKFTVNSVHYFVKAYKIIFGVFFPLKYLLILIITFAFKRYILHRATIKVFRVAQRAVRKRSTIKESHAPSTHHKAEDEYDDDDEYG